MQIAWCTTLSILCLTNVAYALRSGKYCPRACELTLNYATFNDTDPWLSRKVRQCRSNLRITSLYLCFDEFCDLTDGEVARFIAENREWCDEHAGVTLPSFHEVVDQWSSEERAQLPKHTAEKAMTWPVLSTAVIPEAGFLERAFATLVGNLISHCSSSLTSHCSSVTLTGIRMLLSPSTTFILSTDGICTISGSSFCRSVSAPAFLLRSPTSGVETINL
jgi:hypothetical protein